MVTVTIGYKEVQVTVTSGKTRALQFSGNIKEEDVYNIFSSRTPYSFSPQERRRPASACFLVDNETKAKTIISTISQELRNRGYTIDDKTNQ